MKEKWDKLMENNKQKVAGSLFWSYGERVMAQLVSLIVSIVLARLLEPDHYGIISIVMIFITLCDAIVAGGFGNSIIQKRNADELDVNTILWCSILTSILLYIIVFITAPYIAQFYQMAIICPVLRVLGLRLLISGVNSIQRAWIQKRMLFKRFFISTLFGTLISAIVGIVMAYKGLGVWSLVAQYLVNSFIDTVVLFLTNDWRPKMQFSWIRAKELLSYGWKVLLTTVVYTIENDIRSLIIGKKFSAADLAYYDQGKKFPNLIVTNINTTIGNVMFPVLSNHQNDLKRVKGVCRRTIRTSTYLLAPLLIGLIAVAEIFIKGILSEKWTPCIPYLRVLTIIYLVRPLTTTCQQTIMALGRSDITLKIIVSINIADICLLLIAVLGFESVLLIACGALAAECLGCCLFMYYTKKYIGYRYREQLDDIGPSLVLAIIMGIVVNILGKISINNLLLLIIQIIVGAVFYIGLSAILHFEPLMYLVKMVEERIKSHKVKKIVKKYRNIFGFTNNYKR